MPEPVETCPETTPIISAWRLLSRVERMRFTATPGTGSRTGWAGRGTAQVRVQTDGPCLRLHEEGVFRVRGSDRRTAFRNVFRWELGNGALSLWHERFGSTDAVFLFQLQADGPRRLVSGAAHLCGADRYSARAGIEPDRLTLDWHIQGPAKNERLHYIYSAAAGSAGGRKGLC